MHEGAYLFVAGVVAQLRPRRVVIELGSRTVAGDWPYSGPVRPLFGEVLRYIGVDMMPGPNVDVVGNAATVHPYGGPVDTVVCCETFEHTFEAEQICANAHSLLTPGGLFICTAAGEGRAPHSATDGGALRDVLCERTGASIKEFYRNVTREQLEGWLAPFGFAMIDTSNPGDIYAVAVKVA